MCHVGIKRNKLPAVFGRNRNAGYNDLASRTIDDFRRANVNLTREVEDMRLINRAKYVLIESLGYSENRAHKFIERRAMDERKTRREIALEILKTYEI